MMVGVSFVLKVDDGNFIQLVKDHVRESFSYHSGNNVIPVQVAYLGGPAEPTARDMPDVDFTVPFLSSHLQVVSRGAEAKNPLRQLQPFDAMAWVTSLGVFTVVSKVCFKVIGELISFRLWLWL
jgi:hypothetical protein